jgi:hypothetical protein
MSLRKTFVTLAALLVAMVAALPAAAQPSTHQWVRVKNATASAIKISYLSPSGQKWQDIVAGDYTDADVARGPAGNFLVQQVSSGTANQANTKLTTPPANPTSEVIRVYDAMIAATNISWLSPGGQLWATINPSFYLDVTIARGPAGYLLLQFVP